MLCRKIAQHFVEFALADFGHLGDQDRGPDRHWQGIAGNRLDQRRPGAGTGIDALVGVPEGFEVPSINHWKLAFFFAGYRFDFPSPRGCIFDNSAVGGGAVERCCVGIISVFDENLGVAERQAIDEAIAVNLLDRRIHNDWSLQSVRLFQPEHLAAKFLPADIQRRNVAATAHIEHRFRRNFSAI